MKRRELLCSSLAVGATLASQGLLPAWARSAAPLARNGLTTLSGTEFDLAIDRSPITIEGITGHAISVNGTVPAPLLRWREGDTVTLRVHNHLDEATSIHWHGILLPFQMDGVPGVSFPGIGPGKTFTYRFPVKQAGTYWYHSHSNLQEQIGHYGPLIIDPRGADPVGFDRELVLVLADWTWEHPHALFGRLKKMSESFNFQKLTAADFLAEAGERGLAPTLGDWADWARMRMSRTDIADVTGATYTYLVNGHGPADKWTGLFEPGERVRLRIINASAMTLFNVRIPGLPMTVVQADGLNVQPLETDEFQIGVAETYDVVVEPREDRAYTVMCESIDRQGYARATLAPRPGMHAEVPPLREPPMLTMKDMGMAHHGDHGGHGAMAAPESGPAAEPGHQGMDHGSMDHGSMDHGSMDHGSMDHGSMDHSSMGHGETTPEGQGGGAMDHAAMDHAAMAVGAAQRHDHPGGPGVANVALEPVSRLDEPGIGLEDVPHRALTYAQLRSLEPNPDPRPPGREIELHLTSNMHRYMWSFDGRGFAEVVEPIVFHEGERLRMTLVNDTMMPHPIHLHGMFFQLVNGGGAHQPNKHTIIVKPGEKLSIDLTADAVGDWAFHCHLLYHMHAGMFRVVSVRPRAGEGEA